MNRKFSEYSAPKSVFSILLGVLFLLNLPLIIGLPFTFLFMIMGFFFSGTISIDEKLVSSLWIGYTLFAVAGGVWIFLNIIINSGRLLGFLLGKNEPNKLWSKDIGNWPVWMIPLILLLSYYGHSYLSVITTGDFNAITSPTNYLYFYFDTIIDVMASNPDD